MVLSSTNVATRIRLGALILLSIRLGYSAELKPETLTAWDDYIAQETAQVKQRATLDKGFLWTDAQPNRYNDIRNGGTVVEPMGEHNPLRVEGGLIHHWISAVFIPNAHIDDVLAITRDYAHYKDFYKPGVADASTISKSDAKDEFTIRFVNPSVLSKSSLQGNYVSNFYRLGTNRFYSTSVTTSMCEIKNFGCPNEKRLSQDQGSGYIWRLYSTARMEERDGGVLLEMEAIALSRGIPAALRWFVDPIVRRVSRESIEKSLNDTATAVRARLDACEAQNPHQIIGAGNCSQHAGNSDLRAKRLAGDAGR